MRNIARAIAAACVSAVLVMPGTAYAVSYPTVDDVNDWGARSSIVTVTASGHGKLKLKATSAGKRLKVTRHKCGVWTVVVRNGSIVKLTASDKDGKRTVKYAVCK